MKVSVALRGPSAGAFARRAVIERAAQRRCCECRVDYQRDTSAVCDVGEALPYPAASFDLILSNVRIPDQNWAVTKAPAARPDGRAATCPGMGT